MLSCTAGLNVEKVTFPAVNTNIRGLKAHCTVGIKDNNHGYLSLKSNLARHSRYPGKCRKLACSLLAEVPQAKDVGFNA